MKTNIKLDTKLVNNAGSTEGAPSAAPSVQRVSDAKGQASSNVEETAAHRQEATPMVEFEAGVLLHISSGHICNCCWDETGKVIEKGIPLQVSKSLPSTIGPCKSIVVDPEIEMESNMLEGHIHALLTVRFRMTEVEAESHLPYTIEEMLTYAFESIDLDSSSWEDANAQLEIESATIKYVENLSIPSIAYIRFKQESVLKPRKS